MRKVELPPITEEVIAKVLDRIVEECEPETIWLFGSAAQKDTREGSDLDLLILKKLPEGVSHNEFVARIRALFRGWMVPMDIVVLDRETFEYWKDTPGHLAYTVARHGRRVYG